ncbi:MAG TPA: alpha/beta hydrolase [Vicinamibacterales bacterium]|jgi:pimeloyl-ACP methyl ester carboxylesterase|nr:alpha/beta hydrolase [Vicinamibacterales bacterium]
MRLASATFLIATVVVSQPTAFRVQVAGHGRPMILIPGLSSSGDTWQSTVEHYKDRFTCHTVTLAGFAGVPPTDGGPLLASVRDQLAAYIEAQRLEKPIVVGHSLGGNVAMDLAARRPDLVGPLVIVDSLPFYANVMFHVDTAEAAKPMIEGMRGYLSALTRQQYDDYVRSHAATKFMVTKPADLERLTDWGLQSDPKTVYTAMFELYGSDLRSSLARISSPTLLLGTWIGIRDQAKQGNIDVTKENVIEAFRTQYAPLPRLHFALSESSRHFIMLDDPTWLYEQVDAFLANPMDVTAERGFTR